MSAVHRRSPATTRLIRAIQASSAGAALVILAASALSCAPDPGTDSPEPDQQSASAGVGTSVPMNQSEEAHEPDPLDFEAHAAALRERWGDGFTVVIEKPFVVVGDEPAAVVRRRAAGTVRWAVAKLKADYFEHDPDHIITVYLFRNRASYETHAEQLSGRVPHTPYGYYSPRGRMMVMNIATGGGTLVHEIVHPFVAANFPGCPAWVNEGLGSLYEQSAERDGRIVGKTNWRLAGLHRSIADDSLPTIEYLCGLTDRQFYGEGSGTHYAMARYLCYYLQEQGKLRGFYHDLVANHADDPTGYATLRATLGDAGDDMAQFQRDWQDWAMTLRFP